MTRPCGCCAGCRAASPERIRNRPGLSRLETRLGTHQSFFAAMVARLSSDDFARLAPLRSRSRDDPGIALLDAWAMIADVLAFYQERIANEAYLRTATERRSLVEIARLVGYRPRPGVAAAAPLAFALENEAVPGEIPKGTRVNSVPGPGEKMVTFETSEPITARREWNAIRPRLVRPQDEQPPRTSWPGLYLKGTSTRLEPNAPLLIRIGDGAPELKFVHSLVEDHDNDRTLVRFEPPLDPAAAAMVCGTGAGGGSVHGIPSASLLQAGSVPPAGAAALPRRAETSFAGGSDALPRLLGAIRPGLRDTLYKAMRNVPNAAPPWIRVYALRVDARPFGHNAPLRLDAIAGGVPKMKEWEIQPPADATMTTTTVDAQPAEPLLAHGPRDLFLDNEYNIGAHSMVAIVRIDAPPIIILGTPEARPKEQLVFPRLSMSNYGMSGKSTLIHWQTGPDQPNQQTPVWLTTNDKFITVRTTRVFAASEELALAEAPILDDVAEDRIELDGVYDGFEPGRWLIVEGERSDICDAGGRIVPGVTAAELVMLASVEQVADSAVAHPDPATGLEAAPAGGKLRTVITLAGQAGAASGLSYRYRRDTVRIHANVARATHGETRAEVIGNGDAAVAMQSFVLRQPPLTHVSAPTPSGIASTLEIRVNDLLWHETASLAGLGPTDRNYVTRDSDGGVTSVQFGNGVRGARVPTGRENVKAVYRTGLGRMGNVAAGQLSLLATRPLGVKAVVNPLRASGGADRESAESIRRNAPVALMALDRLVSTSDYQHYARSFGGVGKARAVRTPDQGIDAVTVIVAGVDDIPIDAGSELIRNLAGALRRFGDRQLPLRIEPRKRLILVLQANVAIDPDHRWDVVEPKIRAALLEEFGFERIELGEWLPLGRALKAIQSVPGVVYADVDIFDRLTEQDIFNRLADTAGTPTLKRLELLEVGPDEIAYLAPDVPDTLILQEVRT